MGRLHIIFENYLQIYTDIIFLNQRQHNVHHQINFLPKRQAFNRQKNETK